MWTSSIEGIAQPLQLVRSSTPKGRGRWASRPSSTATFIPTIQTASHTIRCRQRRRTSNASGSTSDSAIRIHQEPMCARPCHSPTSPGACSPPSQRTMASSTTVAATAATSQPTPLVCRR
jgi:hypothetical protein